MYLELSSVEVTGNIIEQNNALIGAGLYITGYGVIIQDNIIRYNIADSLGGGIHASYENITLRDNLITQNTAQYGGGLFFDAPSYWTTSLVVSNTISSNHASVLGGGIYCKEIGSSHLHIMLNNIFNNHLYGLYNEDTVSINAEHNWWGHASGPYHPVMNPAGNGDSVSDFVDFIPWSQSPIGIEEQPIAEPVDDFIKLPATIISGQLELPRDKKCRVIDITGRETAPGRISPGVYFIEVDGIVVRKVIKIK